MPQTLRNDRTFFLMLNDEQFLHYYICVCTIIWFILYYIFIYFTRTLSVSLLITRWRPLLWFHFPSGENSDALHMRLYHTSWWLHPKRLVQHGDMPKKNQVIEEGVYFGSQLESVVYHENEVPAEKLETTSQITSLVMKHSEMKTSSLFAFFLSPTLCPRYMKRCSFQLNCVVLPQFRSRKSLTGIQMIVSRSCRAEN